MSKAGFVSVSGWLVRSGCEDVKLEVNELDVVEMECEKDWKVEKDEQRSAKDKREPTSTPLSLPSLFLLVNNPCARSFSLSLCLRLRLRRLVGKRLKSRENVAVCKGVHASIGSMLPICEVALWKVGQQPGDADNSS